MASSDRRSETLPDTWLKWLWVPIVVPGLVLGWLAWRAVVNEQSLLREQVAEGRLRIASQVAGILQGAGREFHHQATIDLASWALEIREAPDLPLPQTFDAAAVYIEGTRANPLTVNPSRSDAVQIEMALGMTLAELSRSSPRDGLALAERFLMDALHAKASALPSDLRKGVDRLEKAIEDDLAIEPHWRPVFEDLLEGVRHRIRNLAICRAHEPLMARLAASGRSGLHNEGGLTWLVLAPPDLPQGEVVVAAFSDRMLQARLANDLPGFGGDSLAPSSILMGLHSEASGYFLRDSMVRLDSPIAMVPVPGRFPAWSVAVWSGSSEGENAARFRAVLIAALLGLSIAILVGAAWLTTRSIASQRQLLAMKTDFVSNVTHELKTPLTGIFLYAELLAGGKAEGRSKEFGAVVLREARRLEGMIDGILSFARQEAGHAASRRDRLALDDLVRECCESFQGVARQKDIAIDCELGRVAVPGDPALLRSIVGNLVDNAVKYGKPGGFVQLSLVEEAGLAVLRVRDDGRGIPREQHSKVFDRFFRGGGELTRNVPGTGLGLAIVKRAVEIHGGEIRLHSDIGSGTTVEVRLPRSEEPHA